MQNSNIHLKIETMKWQQIWVELHRRQHTFSLEHIIHLYKFINETIEKKTYTFYILIHFVNDGGTK